jgi:hypothetical protein
LDKAKALDKMATAISKLRKDFMKERKDMIDIMKTVKSERSKTSAVVRTVVVVQEHKKMEIDQEKLERSIKKACIPVEKKTIVFIDKPPAAPPVAETTPPPALVLCAAKNLNGTPCKCRAKIGKFCAKHAP